MTHQRKKYLVGNLKMNGIRQAVPQYFEDFFAAGAPEGLGKTWELGFAFPFLSLKTAQDCLERLAHKNGIHIYAQNFHQAQSGAFTGETSLSMLKEVGIDAALVGHSERRQYFGESDSSVAEKVKSAFASR